MGGLNDNDRNLPAQQPPRPGADATAFPWLTPDKGRMYRVTRSAYPSAWHFASRPDPQDGTGGRFDLPAPRGTCYWANSPEVGLREVIGPFLASHGWVSAALLRGRVVAMADMPDDVRLADLEHPDANRTFGIVGDLITAPDSVIPQLWAAVLDGGGLDGILYRARYSGPGRPNAFAFFGTNGERRQEHPSRLPGLDQVCERAGIQVIAALEESTAAAFDVVEPPRVP